MVRRRLTDGWEHFTGGLGGVWEVWRGDKLTNHFNVPWRHVRVPHCFNASDAVDPDVTYYQGPGWYRTRPALDNPYEDGRTLLHFEGAGQRSTVFVYTEEVGSHLGGYDEFSVDITEAADRAARQDRYVDAVPVAVCCDNSRDLEMIPSDAADFNLYGGLYRNVNLEYRPAISIRRVHIETPEVDKTSARVVVRAELYNPAERVDEMRVSVIVSDPAGTEVARIAPARSELGSQSDAGGIAPAEAGSTLTPWRGMRELATVRLDSVELWDPDSPALYTCRVEIEGAFGTTYTEERFGLRFFEFQERGPFFMNGRRLLIRGTHRHEDHAGLGAAMPEDLIRKELSLIKDMGANFVRLGHYQQSRTVLDCCDELGLLVWEEIPWCRGGLGGDRYRKQARDMLSSMIDQHYNHPSVIIWGLGNENDWECDFDYFDTDEIRRFMTELNQQAHKSDPSRVTAIRRCEFCKDIVDIYSPSIWSGWYRGVYPDYARHTRAAFEDTARFIHMEWGADNVAGRHAEELYTGFGPDPSTASSYAQKREATSPAAGSSQGPAAEPSLSVDGAERDGDFFRSGGNPRVSKDGDWSETYFCDLIDWYLSRQEEMPWLTGTAQWVFKDFSTPVRPENPIPYVNQKGVVQRDLRLKEGYFVFQSYWADRSMVHIYGHNRPLRWGSAGEAKLVRVYSNCPRVELFVNGTSCGVRERDPADFPCAGLRWHVRLEKGANDLEAVAVGAGSHAGDQLRVTYQTDEWGVPARFLLEAHREHGGRARIDVALVDEAGVLCADSMARIRFSLAGTGRLLDNLGTVTGSRVVELTNGHATIHAESGVSRSIVAVAPEDAGGDIAVATEFIEIGG